MQDRECSGPVLERGAAKNFGLFVDVDSSWRHALLMAGRFSVLHIVLGGQDKKT